MNLLKLFYMFLSHLTLRKSGNVLHLSLLVIIFFCLYITTTYYTLNTEKLHPLQEIFNETIFAETTLINNIEATSPPIPINQLINETITTSPYIKIGKISVNCGLPYSCNDGEFPVHIYTGKDHKDEPQLCVDGKYILSKKINGGGRGINAVIIDNMTRTIIQVSHFDTYEKESTPLETLLLTLRPGDIVILLTFDEPSRKMSRIAKLLLFELGSALIQNLNYRASWFLISQKGISGFTPFEKLNLVENNGWPKHHDVRFCVPFTIKGQTIHPDPNPTSNPERVKFCNAYNNFPVFCDADVVNDPLSPAPVWKHATSVNKIYNVPILVMSGSNIQLLPLTLETLIRQSGIKPSIVVVYHLEKNDEVQNLTNLFGFMSEELSQTSSYCDQVQEAFEIANFLFPNAKEMIFIGENAILTPDFLYYMGQLISLLSSDSSINSISAWNENGFKDTSSDSSLLYRVETFSGLAILVRRNFFKKTWCSNDSLTDPLYLSSKVKGENIIPDVPRVALAGPQSFDSLVDIQTSFFAKDRTVTFEQNIVLKNVERLYKEEYEKDIEFLLTTAMPLVFDTTSLMNCLQNGDSFTDKLFAELPLFIRNSTNFYPQVLAIYYHQENQFDTSIFRHLSQCLGLFYHPLYPNRNFYKGLLRFMLKDNQAFLVSSLSPFYRFKPRQVPILRMEGLKGLSSTLLRNKGFLDALS